MSRGSKVLCAVLALACAAAWPQAAPAQDESVEDMIQKLQSRPATGASGRTRSLRNLIVEPGAPGTEAAPGAAEAGRPSLSLLIQFDFDSATVRPESLPSLERLVAAIQSPQLAASRFAIEGHTDARGSADYNLDLSERRARAVRDLLVKNGVAAGRLYSQGMGATRPANAADPLAAENRRVRIVNLD